MFEKFNATDVDGQSLSSFLLLSFLVLKMLILFMWYCLFTLAAGGGGEVSCISGILGLYKQASPKCSYCPS